MFHSYMYISCFMCFHSNNRCSSPIGVPIATCTSAVSCVSTATTAAQGPISVPIATCASTVPCVSRTASTARDPLNDPVVSSSVLPRVSTETFAQPLPTLRILHGVFEYSFPFEFSQSSIAGRNGSNACTFIALCFGKLFVQQKLPLPVNSNLNSWIAALHYAIIKGNDTHDALFDNDAVNLSVQEAVEMAGDECGVHTLG